MRKPNYKNCYVPGCRSTTITTPNKIFISVPLKIKFRKVWFKAVQRNVDDISPKSHLYCCEDHFNLPEDMENYQEVKMMGVRIRMKKNVVPHIFVRQRDKKPRTLRCSCNPLRSIYSNRLRVRTTRNKSLDEMMSQPSTSTPPPQQELEVIDDIVPQPSTSQKGLEEGIVEAAEKARNIGVNVKLRQTYRSKAVMCTLLPTTTKQPHTTNKEEPIKNNETNSDFSKTSNTGDRQLSETIDEFKSLSLKCTNNHIENKPKMYLGITKSLHENKFIELLSQETNLSTRDINITLMKIKLNDSFERLGDMFGISETIATSIFNKSVICLSKYFNQFIYWPDKETIIKLLPIPFRYRYSNVESIIYCLEIKISESTKYKKCKTLKYLISSTPDGFINFVSEGVDGSITDTQLVEQCNDYLNVLPEGCGVLVNKVFNGILTIIKNKNCHLMKLPSGPAAGTAKASSREDVLSTKSIDCLKNHIERVIRRLREYEMLKPHTVVPSCLVPIIDNVVIIAVGLINLQMPLINHK